MSAADMMPQHGGHLTIDLSALVANWRRLALRAPDAACAGVVKANAYGCGQDEVAHVLSKAGCQTFFVAHLNEAVRLRQQCPTVEIYVLNGLPPQHVSTYLSHQLIPVLGSMDEITEWTAHTPQNTACALHVDTGMNRLGIHKTQLPHLPADFHPTLVMSHFVASETVGDPVTSRQLADFAQIKTYFQAKTYLKARSSQLPRFSLANSSGCFLDPVPAYDLLRPGYALYGGNPTPHLPNPMQPVVRLRASLIQVRSVPANTQVGYNGVWQAPRDTRIATVSLGYADGYLRSGLGANQPKFPAKTGAKSRVDGVLCPIIGRVSMDLITLDVTDAPSAQRGTWAEFIGADLSVDQVANDLGTNGYEVLTSLGRRHSRHYIGG